MTLLETSTDMKTFDEDNWGYLVPNPPPEALPEQADVVKADGSYMNMNENNEIHTRPLIVDDSYIEISNAKRQVSGSKNSDAVRYTKSPRQGTAPQNREDDHQDESAYTEIFFQKNFHSDREPIFHNKQGNTKLVSVQVLLFVLILLLAVPIVYLFVVVQGQNRTLVNYEGKIKLLDEKLQTLDARARDRMQQNNCSCNLDALNASLEALAQVTFAKVDINSNLTSLELRTALHVAAKEGQIDRIKFLVSHGADLEVKDLTAFTPLHLAALYRHVDVINLLLDEGAMVDAVNSLKKTALFFAIRSNCLTCVQILLARGADVFHQDSQSTGPLDFANQNNHSEIARFIQDYMEKNTTRLL